MAKPSSLDLRQKVFAAWQAGEGSREQVAERFGVSRSFARDLAALCRQSGAVEARAHGGGRASPLHEAACRQAVRAAVAAQNDATIRGAPPELGSGGSLPWSHPASGRALLASRADTQKKTLKDDEAATERVEKLREDFARQVAGISRARPGVCGRERGQPRHDRSFCPQPGRHARLRPRPAQPGRERDDPSAR